MTVEKDTLAYQMIRPGVVHRDISNVHLPDLVNSVSEMMKQKCIGGLVGDEESGELVSAPEEDALVFYMLNHAVTIIRQKVHPYESLGRYMPIVSEYHKQLSYRSARVFAYMLMICTRESRHIKNKADSLFMKQLFAPTGSNIKHFHSLIRGTGSSTAVCLLKDEPPHVTLGEYTDYLVKAFNEGQFSSGYGGKAWGAIAQVLRDYSWGVITAEMLMDTAFTLCHNNGPIFNKGMLYSSYSDQIYVILDVQRSGQIPQLIGNKECTKGITHYLRDWWSKCNDVMPNEFSGYVDWFLVEALGSKKMYPQQKKDQTMLHGEPPMIKAKKLAEVIKHKMDVVKKDVDVDEVWVDIMPTLKVKVIARGV